MKSSIDTSHAVQPSNILLKIRLVALSCMLIITALLVLTGIAYITLYSRPSDVTVTSITASTAVITWTTPQPMYGAVAFDQLEITTFPVISALNKTYIFDQRYYKNVCEDISPDCTLSVIFGNTNFKALYTHSVLLTGLDPDTTYAFAVGNGLFWKRSLDFSFKTASDIGELRTPQPIYGSIEYEDGKPVTDSILFLTLENQDNVQSQTLSTTTNTDGTWVYDLSYVRNADLTSYFEFDEEGFERIDIQEGPRNTRAWVRNSAAVDTPVTTIVISELTPSSQSGQSPFISQVLADNIKCATIPTPDVCWSHSESGCIWFGPPYLSDGGRCEFVEEKAKQDNPAEDFFLEAPEVIPEEITYKSDNIETIYPRVSQETYTQYPVCTLPTNSYAIGKLCSGGGRIGICECPAGPANSGCTVNGLPGKFIAGACGGDVNVKCCSVALSSLSTSETTTSTAEPLSSQEYVPIPQASDTQWTPTERSPSYEGNVGGHIVKWYTPETMERVLDNQERWGRLTKGQEETFRDDSGIMHGCAPHQLTGASHIGSVIAYKVENDIKTRYCLVMDVSAKQDYASHVRNDGALDLNTHVVSQIKDDIEAATGHRPSSMGLVLEHESTIMSYEDYCRTPEGQKKCVKDVGVKSGKTKGALPPTINVDLSSNTYAEDATLQNEESYTIDTGSVIIFHEAGIFDIQTDTGTYDIEVSQDNKAVLYEDINLNGVRDDEDLIIDPKGFVVSIEKTQDVFEYELTPGINFISFPFMNSELLTSEDLLRHLYIEEQIEVTEIAVFDDGWHIQKYRGEINTFYGDPIAISPGKGYAVRAYQPATFSIRSDQVVTENVPLSIKEGWQLVSFPFPNSLTADLLLTEAASSGVSADTCTKWENSRFDSYIKDPVNKQVWGDDFTIEVTQGYFLKSRTSGTFQP